MKKGIKEIFGENVRFFLKKSDMTQAHLAEKVGVTPATTQRWVQGQMIPVPETLDKVADVFKIEPCELFIRSNIENEYKTELNECLNHLVFQEADQFEQESIIKEINDSYLALGVPEKDGELSIDDDYARPFGRVLPGFPLELLELLKFLDIRDKEKEFLNIGFAAMLCLKEKSKSTLFYEKITTNDDRVDYKSIIDIAKKQFAKDACKLAGVGALFGSHALHDKIEEFLSNSPNEKQIESLLRSIDSAVKAVQISNESKLKKKQG